MTDKDTRQDPTEPVGPDTTVPPDAALSRRPADAPLDDYASGADTAGHEGSHGDAAQSAAAAHRDAQGDDRPRDASPDEASTPDPQSADRPTAAVPVVPEPEAEAAPDGAPPASEPAPAHEPAAVTASAPASETAAAASETAAAASETAAPAAVPASSPTAREEPESRRANASESAEVRKMDRAAAIAAAKRPAAGTGPKPRLDAEAQRRNAAREAALTAKPVLARILQVLLAVAFPFLLVIGAIKAVASPWFLWLEYNRPGFPADRFGFTADERLTYGSYGVDYLNNAAGPDYLASLVGTTGGDLFLASEVSHMADVKAVVAATFLAGLILLAAAVLIAFYLGRKYAGGIRRGLFAGAVATVVAMLAVGVLAAMNWQAFFSGFHQIFFADGTWTFSFSDTLIRLFPPQFWIDAGIAVAGLVLLAALGTLIATWPTARRRERSRLLQEARDFGLR